ncbi:MAG: hypothetical protein MI806_12495 [Minwuiales bacterium]|nr:hypothetical protein [Minwuiales bacterium]
MLKIGLISNMLSQRNRAGLEDLRDLVARNGNAMHAELDGIEGLSATLKDFAAKDVGVVAVNGGDGSVQATLTALFRDRPFERTPALAVLPGGMTNTIANDIGHANDRAKALARVFAACGNGAVPATTERNVIRVDYRPDGGPEFGMLFGTAAIPRAIEVCHRAIHPMKLQSSAAVGATLAAMLVRMLLKRGNGDAVLYGDDMTVRVDDGASRSGSRLIALATTLNRIMLRSRPYWGHEPGPLRYTEIAYPARKLMRSVYPVMYGGPDRRFPTDDYVSHNADKVTMDMACRFMIDGEMFDPTPGVPVTLTGGQKIRFLPC